MPRYESVDGGIHVLLNENYDMFHDGQITGSGVRPFEDLKLVRTSLEMADIEDKLLAAFVLGERKKDPRFALARKLANPRLARDFDVVLIDTPPRLTMASINGFCASTHVLIPTSLSATSRSGAVTFVHYLKELRNKLCPSIRVLGILATFTALAKPSEAEQKMLDELERYLPGVDIWRDVCLPSRQEIANNRVLQSRECRDKFIQIARKVATYLGLKRNGNSQGRDANRSPKFSRAGQPY